MVHEFCSDKNNQGGGVAAPIASQVLGEVLPYLEISKSSEEQIKNTIIMPSLIGIGKDEVKEILETQGLEFEINEAENLSDTPRVIKQVPEQGVKLEEGSKIILYVE